MAVYKCIWHILLYSIFQKYFLKIVFIWFYYKLMNKKCFILFCILYCIQLLNKYITYTCTLRFF